MAKFQFLLGVPTNKNCTFCNFGVFPRSWYHKINIYAYAINLQYTKLKQNVIRWFLINYRRKICKKCHFSHNWSIFSNFKDNKEFEFWATGVRYVGHNRSSNVILITIHVCIHINKFTCSSNGNFAKYWKNLDKEYLETRFFQNANYWLKICLLPQILR